MAVKEKAEKLLRLMSEMLEMARDMHDIGTMDEVAYRKIMMRGLPQDEAATSRFSQRRCNSDKAC